MKPRLNMTLQALSTGVVAAAVGLGLLFAGAAPAAADDPPAEPAAAAATPDGAAIWGKKCKTCHGEDGKATKVGEKKNAPANLADKTAKMDHEKIVKVITEGEEKMPAFKDKLTAEEIEAVAKYCKTLGTPTKTE